MKLFAVMLLLALSSILNAQNKEIKDPSTFFPAHKKKVLVVGTFHFDYPNLDALKTEDKNKIDVLTEPKKSEVTELVKYIEKFQPTVIAIEARENWKATEKLSKYKMGAYRDQRDERFQLAMRIASDLKLDTLYSVDTGSLDEDLSQRDSVFIQNLFKDFDFKTDDPYFKYYMEMVAYEDTQPAQNNLLSYFKHINSLSSHQYGYGVYLVGDFNLDDTRGADVLSIWWYNRNLRIFRKIQQIQTTPEDRILVVIGNGHAAVLRQLLECSPEFEFVEFGNL